VQREHSTPVRDARIRRGLTQNEAAEAAGVSVGWYRTIERVPRFMSRDLAERLGEVLDVAPEILLDGKYSEGSP